MDSATVYLIIIRQAGGLFSEPYRDSQPAQLLLQAGKWKISNMPYPYWDYSWYHNRRWMQPVNPYSDEYFTGEDMRVVRRLYFYTVAFYQPASHPLGRNHSGFKFN